jgi:hypothetical protein
MKQITIIPVENRLESNLVIQKVRMTPSVARKLLSNTQQNRSVKKKNISKLVDNINRGLWDSENGQTIKIDQSGKLIDGQHRLYAIVESKKTVDAYVAFNCSSKAMNNVDTGANRTLNDILKLNGLKYYTLVGGIIQSESVIKRGISTSLASKHTEINSYQHILNIAEENKEYLNFVCSKAAALTKKYPLFKVGFYTKYFNILFKIDKTICNTFLDELSAPSTNIVPIQVLKKVLLEDLSKSVKKMTSSEKEALFIKTWNNYVEGVDNKILKWSPTQESFPKLKRLEVIDNYFI